MNTTCPRVSVALASGLVLAFAMLASVTAYAADKPADKPAGTTLDNLIAAFDGESNANARYIAFAKKADEEGFKGAAALFRGAARAEEIHAANHKKVIEALGGKAQADIKAPEVKSTKENLEAAIKGESYERDTMYPEFIAKARKDNNKDALRSFNFAKTAEAEHAKLYKTALDGLDTWKEAKTFYVCPICGYTTTSLNFEKCVSCFTPKEKYISVA
ncbi:MAG: rubrerythrin [Candidatus Hydrogenedentes bacterium]|nr:rubrerythrin [Candidatus Hydrogenedentota bacterium]